MSTNETPDILSLDEVAIVIRRDPVRRVIRWSLAGLGLAALAILAVKLQSLIVLFVLSAVLASLLEPPVREMESRGLPRSTAILIVYAVILGLVALLVVLLAPHVSQQVQSLVEGIQGKSPDEIVAQLQDRFFSKVPLLNSPGVSEKLTALIESLMSRLMSVALWLFSGVTTFFVVLFITFFLLKDGNRMKKAVISRVPNRHFELALSLSYRISQQVSRYVRGQLMVAMVVGLLSIIALYLLNIRYYFFIGALAGLANMIPYFGPVVGALPAIVVALIDTGSFHPVIGIVVAFATIQLIDNVLVSPTIVSKSVEIHPLLVAVVVLVGGTLAGLAGMLFAVPIAGSIKVTIEEVQRYLKFRSRLQQTAPSAGSPRSRQPTLGGELAATSS